jgi:hypothetical protein
MAGLYGREGRKVQELRCWGTPSDACGHRSGGCADSGQTRISARAEAEARAVASPTVEVEAMVRALRLALAEGRAAGRLP